MTTEEADEHFGKIIYKNNYLTVRLRDRYNKIFIIIIPIIEGIEHSPRAVLLGHNGLDFDYTHYTNEHSKNKTM